MNQINQIIIEGTVLGIDKIKQGLYTKHYCFPIETVRSFKNMRDEWKTETSEFRIKTFGSIAEKCSEAAKIGRGIRVVGRLVNDNGDVHIVADAVEFKPEASK